MACEFIEDADKHAHLQSLMSPFCLDELSINRHGSIKLKIVD